MLLRRSMASGRTPTPPRSGRSTRKSVRGEAPALDGRGSHLKDFQEVYAREFVYRVWDRLEAARNGAMATGGTMVLAGRDKMIEEKFYETFPDLRPAPEPEGEPVVVSE